MIIAHRDVGLAARIVGSRPLAEPAPGVGAGSALVRVRGRLLAIQDDAFEAIWIDPETRTLERLLLHGEGGRLLKPDKPDFEAAFVAPSGDVYVLGSGSAPQRRCIARLELERGAVSLIAAEALYDALLQALGATPNIEGAALSGGDVVTLLHRGSGRSPFANASIDVPRHALDGGPVRVLALRRYDLGSVRGVPLTFTDASPLDNGRLLYLAVAEDTPDAIEDGPIVGGAVGVIDGDSVRYAVLTTESGALFAGKAEGVALDAGGRAGFVLTDPDSPDVPSELCRLSLEGPW